MSVEDAISGAVAVAVAPVLAELRALRETVDALRAASPSRLATVAELVRLGYGSPASVRRRIADGTYPAIRHGRSIRVDLAALKPPRPELVAELADKARRA
jgi:hypothetical protein